MDFKELLLVKRSELETTEAEIESLRAQKEALMDEVITLEKAAALVDKYGVRVAPLGSATPRNERMKRPEKKKPGMTLADGIRTAVREIVPPITIPKVRERIARSLYKNPSSIISTMRRMAEDGELVVIEKGGPGKGAVYGLPPTNRELFAGQPRSADRADEPNNAGTA